MLPETTNNIQKQLHWDSISDEDVVALKAEFASEDLELAEAALSDYLSTLQEEDEA